MHNFILIHNEYTRAEHLINLRHVMDIKCGDDGKAVLLDTKGSKIYCAETYESVKEAIRSI